MSSESIERFRPVTDIELQEMVLSIWLGKVCLCSKPTICVAHYKILAVIRTVLEKERTDHERIVKALKAQLFKNVCRIHTEWMIDRYLMSNAINRLDPAEKAQRHIELCKFYVSVARGCSLENAMSDYEVDFDRLHEQSQELTSSLNTEIGFPLDQTPNYADLNPKFFERFHAIACRVLGIPDAQPSLTDAIKAVEKMQDEFQTRERLAEVDVLDKVLSRLKSLGTHEGEGSR